MQNIWKLVNLSTCKNSFTYSIIFKGIPEFSLIEGIESKDFIISSDLEILSKFSFSVFNNSS